MVQPSVRQHLRLLTLFVFWCLGALGFGQTPQLYLKFDGNLADSSAAAIITGVNPNSGWTPTYGPDRFGVASKAIVFTGSQSLQLEAGALLGNSNQALGLRNNAGTNTSFTLTAWVKIPDLITWTNTVFGNLNTPGNVTTDPGTLHAGFGINVGNTDFSFDNTEVNSTINSLVAGPWYHVAFVYDGPTNTQRVYVNGVPEFKRTLSTTLNTIKAADLYLGNWGTATDSSSDFRGSLDEVAVFNTALPAAKIQALYNGVDASALNSLPASYTPPKLPGVLGTTGLWGIREIKAYPGYTYGTLVKADRIINAYATTPAGTLAQYTSSVINFADPNAPGNLGAFASEANFGTNTPGDDNNFLILAKGAVRITIEDDYTFGFAGDEGSRLRVVGQTFISSSTVNGAGSNPVLPAHNGDAIYWAKDTTNSGTVGVVHLVPGDYALEFTYWETSGPSSTEVFAARGAKTTLDGTFQLVGNTAAGGLPLVNDPDTVPTLTANGVNPLFVNNGSPANFPLAWSVANPTTTLSIDHGIGAVGQSGSINLTAPAATTTYTITATTPTLVGNVVATKSVTIYVDAPPTMSLTATDTTIITGTSTTLNWVVGNATTLTLDPGNINVFGQTSRVVSPATTTTYTLTAANAVGATTQQSITIFVGAAPAINSFATADANPLYGAQTTLNWNVGSANTLSIDQNVGPVTGATGSVSIAPLLSTTYTLTATNDYGTSTATTTVNQPTPIGVSAALFTARRVFANTTFPFAGQGYLQSALSLIGTGPNTGQNELNETTQTGYATVNFTDGVDGDFTAGNSNFPGSGNTNYAVQITGTLVVNTPGKYTFAVNSSYGCRLRVDGQEIIFDDGSHNPGDSTGSIALSKPTVSIELISYGVSGSSEVELAWIRPNLAWTLVGSIAPAAPIVRGQVLISEFMADNNSALADEDGAFPDWIEVWNSTNATVSLGTYYLTDDAAIPNKWAFPAWTLGANKYAVVFASLKNRAPAQAVAGQDNPGTLAQPHLHTNFKLAKTGGYLALTQSNGMGGYNTISVFSGYPPQNQDVSYGSSDAEGYIGYMEVPTPGSTNAATVLDFVKDTVFSQHRGRYAAPFNLSITTPTAGSTIRYTTDGSTPSLSHGSVYAGPIPISATTVVRAAAYKAGWKPSNVDTETYLFIDDIVSQTSLTAVSLGFPTSPVNGQVFRYGMTLGNVTAAGAGQGTLADLKTALASAPTICMTTDVGNLVNASTGIYVNPGQHDLFWERPVSLEYINTAGTSEFQINCGARIRGGFSRSTGNPKHAFHLYFRGSLYDGNLNYKIFGNSGASTFSQIDMRSEENYSWSFGTDPQNSLMREEWGRIAQGDTGQPYPRTGYFHLYINGLYWGIYNWEERTEASYGETYLSGTKDNIDVVKSAGASGNYTTEMTDGNFAAWKSLNTQAIALKNDATEAGRTAKYMQLRGLNADGTPNAAYPVLLDVDNLIDYLLVTFYDGSFDAPLSTFLNNGSNNWFGLRDRAGTRGFAYFIHDNEHGLDTGSNSYNRVGPWGGSGSNYWGQSEYGTREDFTRSNPQYVHELLAFSAEYRQRFADRVQRHFFNGGALTTTASLTRLTTLAAQVDPIIHAEAARWGSATLNKTSWLGAKTTITNCINNGGATSGSNTFPAQPRTTLIIAQLQNYRDVVSSVNTLLPLAATLSAPAFSGQFGGSVANPYSFNITNPNGATGTLYYTVNGADPRDIGGAVHAGLVSSAGPIPVTLTGSSTVRARVYNGGTWSALTEAQYFVGPLASSSNLVISKIHYNPIVLNNTTQFVELMNIGNQAIDVSGVHFTLGIQFTFPAATPLLAAGGRLLIVRNMSAFTTAYPSVPAAQIAGIFANSTTLATNGARLQLLDAANATIRDFSYDNKNPWPESPDNGGPCLVLLRPATNPDHAIGANWRASSAIGGTPGSDDALLYSTWATNNGITDPTGTGDSDHDGLTSIVEYGLGANPNVASLAELPVRGSQAVAVGGVVSDYLTLTYTRAIGRDDVSYTVEATNDLGTYVPAIIVGSPNFNGNGTETLTYRHPDPKAGQPKQFLHLRILKLP